MITIKNNFIDSSNVCFFIGGGGGVFAGYAAGGVRNQVWELYIASLERVI